MVAHLLQPLADGLERDPARDVIDEQHPYRLSIVGIRDGPITFLPRSVPNLRSNQHIRDFDVVSSKFHPDCCVRLSLKLVLRISEQELGFSDLGVPY